MSAASNLSALRAERSRCEAPRVRVIAPQGRSVPLLASPRRYAPIPPGSVIVIAAGGTGGHFFPAEALAAELLARGRRIALMTDARSGGLHSAVFAGHDHYVIRGAGIAGRGVVRAAQAVVALAAGTLQARAHPGAARRRGGGRLRRLSQRRAGARHAR